MRLATITIATAVLVTSARAASAFCGFYVSGSNEKLANDATQVVLMREGTRTALSMQNDYKGPPEKFAMVVPVPVVLKKENVKTLPKNVFTKIEELDAPRLVEYWEQDPCSPGWGIGFGAGGLGLRGAGAGGGGAGDGVGLGVKVEAQFTVGEYEIVILSAENSTGLDTWLKQEKYSIPEGAEPVLRPYVAAGSKFFVAKVDPTKVTFEGGRATLSPLRFHYDSETFSLPVRLGLLNSSGTQDLIVHIIGKGKRYEAANYPNVTIPTNFDVSDATRTDFAPFYAALFDDTLAKHPKAVVTEYSWDAGSCDPCPTPPLDAQQVATLGGDVMPTPVMGHRDGIGLGNLGTRAGGGGSGASGGFGGYYGGVEGYVLTRLHLRYTKEALGEDVVFKEATAIEGGREGFPYVRDDGGKSDRYGATQSYSNNFQARYVIRHRWTGPILCDHPERDRWGGPWPADGGAGTSPAQKPTPAKNLAYARRGNMQLASFVRSDVPGVAGGQPPTDLAPAPSASGSATPTQSASGAPTSKGCFGCATASTDGGGLAVLGGGAFALVALVRRARRKRNR